MMLRALGWIVFSAAIVLLIAAIVFQSVALLALGAGLHGALLTGVFDLPGYPATPDELAPLRASVEQEPPWAAQVARLREEYMNEKITVDEFVAGVEAAKEPAITQRDIDRGWRTSPASLREDARQLREKRARYARLLSDNAKTKRAACTHSGERHYLLGDAAERCVACGAKISLDNR